MQTYFSPLSSQIVDALHAVQKRVVLVRSFFTAILPETIYTCCYEILFFFFSHQSYAIQPSAGTTASTNLCAGAS